MSNIVVDNILTKLEELFPNAGCELNYRNIYELCIAVMLSAQTTDKKVNIVTEKLFEKYNNVELLKKANYNDIYEIIKPLGLANIKAKNLINFAKIIVDTYNGEIPSEFEKLITLPGVGRKTANVVLAEGFNVMRIPVDTHVERVSKRLGIVNKNASVLDVENKLMEIIEEKNWHKSHHLLIFFGRYMCKSIKPMCEKCPFKNICTK